MASTDPSKLEFTYRFLGGPLQKIEARTLADAVISRTQPTFDTAGRTTASTQTTYPGTGDETTETAEQA